MTDKNTLIKTSHEVLLKVSPQGEPATTAQNNEPIVGKSSQGLNTFRGLQELKTLLTKAECLQSVIRLPFCLIKSQLKLLD